MKSLVESLNESLNGNFEEFVVEGVYDTWENKVVKMVKQFTNKNNLNNFDVNLIKFKKPIQTGTGLLVAYKYCLDKHKQDTNLLCVYDDGKEDWFTNIPIDEWNNVIEKSKNNFVKPN